jgi:hypothetical protein
MIPIFSFDLSTMSMWFDPTMISQHPDREYLSEILNAGMMGDLQDAVNITVRKDKAPATQAWGIDLLSCVWHEQRHFFDFVLTNYGAFRFRQFLEIYINAGALLRGTSENNTPLIFPIDAVLDPVRMQILGAASLPEFELLATAVSKRKKISVIDRQTVPIDGLPYELGGEAQFEALAYLTQIVGIQEYFGGEVSFQVQEMVPDHIRKNQKYNWFIKIGQHFGLISGTNAGTARSVVNLGPMLPLIYAGLFTRHWEKEEDDEVYSHDLPSYRLPFLIQEIMKDRDAYLRLDLQGQWDYVNGLCRQHWGKTVLEELEADLQKEKSHLEQLKAQDNYDEVRRIFEDYHALRSLLFGIFKADPLAIIDPLRFAREILPLVRPRTVIAYPHGVDEPLPGLERAFGYAEGKHKWGWAYVPEKWYTRQDCLTLEEHDAWGHIISEFAPLAKMLINGRKHKTMLGPELLVAEQMLRSAEVPILFDPLFKFPVEKNAMSSYYHLTKREEAVCDLCKMPVRKPEGFLLAPWWFRYSARNASVAITAYNGGEEGKYRFLRDWSHWVVCDNCLKGLRAHFDWQD